MKPHAYILAGGKSSRMGEDKGLMIYRGKPMISYAIQLLKNVGMKPVIVSANSAYDQFGPERITDIIPDQGPAGGIYTALCHTGNDPILVLSCDSPNISETIIQQLLLNVDAADIVLARHGGKSHQLIGIYHQTCKDVLASQIKKKSLRLRDLFEHLSVNFVDMDELDSQLFHNINSKEDL